MCFVRARGCEGSQLLPYLQALEAYAAAISVERTQFRLAMFDISPLARSHSDDARSDAGAEHAAGAAGAGDCAAGAADCEGDCS